MRHDSLKFSLSSGKKYPDVSLFTRFSLNIVQKVVDREVDLGADCHFAPGVVVEHDLKAIVDSEVEVNLVLDILVSNQNQTTRMWYIVL